MDFKEQRIRDVVEILTDKATANRVIAELRKPEPTPFNPGQVVVDTRNNRLFRWREGMNPTNIRELSAIEIGR